LDQEYNLLPKSTIIVDTEDEIGRDASLLSKGKGCPKGSKSKLKDLEPLLTQLGS
jgi:hypothetical protein